MPSLKGPKCSAVGSRSRPRLVLPSDSGHGGDAGDAHVRGGGFWPRGHAFSRA